MPSTCSPGDKPDFTLVTANEPAREAPERTYADTRDWRQGRVYLTTPPGTAAVSMTTFFHRPGKYLVDQASLRDFGTVGEG